MDKFKADTTFLKYFSNSLLFAVLRGLLWYVELISLSKSLNLSSVFCRESFVKIQFVQSHVGLQDA